MKKIIPRKPKFVEYLFIYLFIYEFIDWLI